MIAPKLYPLQKNPTEWYQSVLRRSKSEIVSIEWNKSKYKSPNTNLLKDQSNKWLDETGFNAEKSEFAIIVPIHNEATFLPSFLATLSFINLPSDARIFFIFITNQCTDNSVGIINDLFSYIGNISLVSGMKTAKFINNHFIHKDISMGGKALAMSEGILIANKFNIRITITIDANNFVDEHTIQEMFKNAMKHFYQSSNVVYLSGMKKGVYKNSLTMNFVKKIRKFKKEKVHEHRSIPVGAWLLCLDSYWISEIGGVPLTTVEDLALGVRAHQDNKKTLNIPTAVIWGYHSSTIRDKFKEEVRFIKGKYQLLDMNKDSLELLQKDTYYLKDLKGRLMFYLQNLKKEPYDIFFFIFCFLFWETALIAARKDYRNDPTSVAWDSISSTKQ